MERRSGPYRRLKRFNTQRQLRAQLRPTDVLLASYPRSGSTWLRFLLADLLVEGHEAFPSDTVELARTIPDFYTGLEEPRFAPCRIIKIHECHPGTSHRFVALVRRPVDVLVSYYHFHRLHNNLTDQTERGIDYFVRESIPSWTRNVRSYVKAVDAGRNGIIITYEDLHEHPQEVLLRVCEFIGVEATAERLSEAIARRSFRNLQEAEAIRPLHLAEGPPPVASERFFRKGQVGSGQSELTDETVELVKKAAGPVYEAAAARAIPPIDGG